MKKTYLLLLCGALLNVLTVSSAPRFFKANSVQTRVFYYYHVLAGQIDYESDHAYANLWLGNDTIVDGRDCVVLWGQEDEKPVQCLGWIYEDEDGYVWRYMKASLIMGDYLLDACKLRDKWMLVFDFSKSELKTGDKILGYDEKQIAVGDVGHPKEIRVWGTDDCELLNGEHVQSFNAYIYGIGSRSFPFENSAVIGMAGKTGSILEYWRDGELIWADAGKSSIEAVPATTSTPHWFDLQGRSTDSAEQGIYICNGKKVLVK